MKIAIVGPVYPFRGGIAHSTAHLAQTLALAGFDTRVFSFRRQFPAWLYPGNTDRDTSERPLHTPAEYPLAPLEPWTWFDTAARIARFGADAVLLNWWVTAWSPADSVLVRLLRRRHIPVALLIHNVMPHEARFFDRWLTRLTLSQGDTLIALSGNEERRLRRLFPRKPLVRSQLPVVDLGGGLVDKAEARRGLGIPEGCRVLLFWGFVRAYKGLDGLIEALGQLRAGGETPFLLVAGEFWDDESKYRRQIARLGLDGLVRIDNRYIPNEEVARYFSAADLFVAPYLDGTQSGAIKTALGYGVPVLVSEAIVSDLPAGTPTFPTGDVAALAAAIEAQLARPVIQPLRPPEQDWIEVIDYLRALPARARSRV